MKSVYIAGPYTAGTEAEEDANIHNAAVVAFNYYMDGYAVYCPHLQTSYIDKKLNKGEVDYADWMGNDIHWLAKCSIVVFLPGWGESRGAVIEHMVARGLGKEIVYWGEQIQRGMKIKGLSGNGGKCNAKISKT